jgi:hypothetical protein
MRTIETGAKVTRKRGYATNSSLAGIYLLAKNGSGRRARQA